MTETKSHMICGGCGLEDRRVEAGGIWHCPNPICRVCGAAIHKETWRSYHTVDDRTYEIDPKEAIEIGEVLLRLRAYEDMRKPIERMLDYWRSTLSLAEVTGEAEEEEQ